MKVYKEKIFKIDKLRIEVTQLTFNKSVKIYKKNEYNNFNLLGIIYIDEKAEGC